MKSSGSRSSQRWTVVTRPRCAYNSQWRAIKAPAWANSPALAAWSMAASTSPACWYQAAARRCSTGTISGSCSASCRLSSCANRGDERPGIGAAPQRQPGQDQPGRPALGPLPQPLRLLGGQLQAHGLVQEGGGLGVGEPQVDDPQLGQLAAGAQPGQGQRRVDPGGHHQVHVGRQMVDEEPEAVMAHPVGDQVVVVKHQHHLRLLGAELVEQLGQHDLGQDVGRTRTLEQAERSLAPAGLPSPARLRFVAIGRSDGGVPGPRIGTEKRVEEHVVVAAGVEEGTARCPLEHEAALLGDPDYWPRCPGR